MTDNDMSDVREVWSRVGQYMQAWADYGARSWQRNQNLWAAVDRDLADGSSASDAAARSWARLLSVGMQNAEDLWSVATGTPDTARYVKVLPTAFLFFDLDVGTGQHTLLDPVEVVVPADVSRDTKFPDEAQIALGGSGVGAGQDAQGVAALLGRLKAHLKEEQQRCYVLQTINPQDDPGPLVPGTYSGLVYLTQPPMPLANLTVVVEGPPPVVDPDT